MSGITRRRTLRRTLVVLLVGTVAVLALLMGIVTHVSVQNQMQGQLDAQLQRAAERAGRVEPPQQTPGTGGEQPPAGFEGPGGSEFELGALLQDDAVVEGSWRGADGEATTLTAEDRAALADAVGQAGPGQTLEVDLSIGEYLVIAWPGPTGSTEITGLPLEPVTTTLTRLDLTLGAAGLAAVALTGITGWIIVRRTLRPLEEVSSVASHVAELPLGHGDVDIDDRVRVQVADSGTEAGDVGRALNLLLDNVGGALEDRRRTEEAMRRFIADASHELRTPLTAIRGYTDLLPLTEQLSTDGARSLERVQAQSARMATLVEDLLLLARLDEGPEGEFSDVDLGEIVLEAVTDAQVAAPDHIWRIDASEEDLRVPGDARRLTQVAVNLLTNAHKHTPAGTTVEVHLARDGDQAVFEVSDDGPGIDRDVVGDVFARFTRADTARSGGEGSSGLGLPIVRAIVESHHGGIELLDRRGRTVFSVRLPAACDELG